MGENERKKYSFFHLKTGKDSDQSKGKKILEGIL